MTSPHGLGVRSIRVAKQEWWHSDDPRHSKKKNSQKVVYLCRSTRYRCGLTDRPFYRPLVAGDPGNQNPRWTPDVVFPPVYLDSWS